MFYGYVSLIPGTKKTHRYRHEALKTADLESRRELALSFLALITLASPTLSRREQLIGAAAAAVISVERAGARSHVL